MLRRLLSVHATGMINEQKVFPEKTPEESDDS